MADFYDGIRILKENGKPIGIEWQLDNRKSKYYYPEDTESPWFIEFCDSVRLEKNMRDRVYRNEFSMPADEMTIIFSNSENAVDGLYLDDEETFVRNYISLLNEKEKKILKLRLANPKLSTRQLAKILSCGKSSICYCLAAMREKYIDLKRSESFS